MKILHVLSFGIYQCFDFHYTASTRNRFRSSQALRALCPNKTQKSLISQYLNIFQFKYSRSQPTPPLPPPSFSHDYAPPLVAGHVLCPSDRQLIKSGAVFWLKSLDMLDLPQKGILHTEGGGDTSHTPNPAPTPQPAYTCIPVRVDPKSFPTFERRQEQGSAEMPLPPPTPAIVSCTPHPLSPALPHHRRPDRRVGRDQPGPPPLFQSM